MGNWKLEIQRLNAIREKLGLTYYRLSAITGEKDYKIMRMFRLEHEPSLGFYLKIKSCLENYVEVSAEEVLVVPLEGAVQKVKVKPKVLKEVSCDCRMSGALFIREKGCKKAKEEHKF